MLFDVWRNLTENNRMKPLCIELEVMVKVCAPSFVSTWKIVSSKTPVEKIKIIQFLLVNNRRFCILKYNRELALYGHQYVYLQKRSNCHDIYHSMTLRKHGANFSICYLQKKIDLTYALIGWNSVLSLRVQMHTGFISSSVK